VAAAVLLVIAAYLFGTGLRAEAPASAAGAAALAELARSRADFHADQSNAARAAANPAGLVAPDEDWATFLEALARFRSDFYGNPNATTAASSSAGLSAAPDSGDPGLPWIKPEGIQASAGADPAAGQSPWIKPEGIKASGAE